MTQVKEPRAQLSSVRIGEDRKYVFEFPLNIRTVNFFAADEIACNANTQALPYLLGHSNGSQLTDEQLTALYALWQKHAKVKQLSASERFEAFLTWLCKNHGYIQIRLPLTTLVL